MKLIPILCFLLVSVPSYGENFFSHPFTIHNLKNENISHLVCNLGDKCLIRCININNNNLLVDIKNVTATIYAVKDGRQFFFSSKKGEKQPIKDFTHLQINGVSCSLTGLVNKE